MNAQAAQCAELITQAQCVAALTGAGISTKAGIPDFRGPKGLYVTRQYDPDKVFDIEYFHKDPKLFYEFARDFIQFQEKLQPTFAHQFLSKLESQGYLKGVVTQNIDSLHQRAGSRNVLEMHGSFWISYCLECNKEFSYDEMREKLQKEEIAHCSCGGVIKPDIVFFGENVKCLSESEALAAQADLFFVIGTSCVVYPAAAVPDYVTGKIVVINMERVNLNGNNVVLNVTEDIDDFLKEVSQCLESSKLE